MDINKDKAKKGDTMQKRSVRDSSGSDRETCSFHFLSLSLSSRLYVIIFKFVLFPLHRRRRCLISTELSDRNTGSE